MKVVHLSKQKVDFRKYFQVNPKSTNIASSFSSGSTLFIVYGSGVISRENGQSIDFLPGQAFFVPAGLKFDISSPEGAMVYRTTVGKNIDEKQ